MASVLVALTLAAFAESAPAAPEQPKWFVVRDYQISACWVALLVKIDGNYRHGSAQTAGGPYDTQEQAAERRKALQENGTCTE